MSFETGLLNFTNWVGNVILPSLSALFFAIGIIRFAGGGQHSHWMYAGLLALMISGILRGLEAFASQLPWSDPDLYWISILGVVNWVCNVIMPLYGVLQIMVGIVHFSGIGHRVYQGGDWMR